MLRLLGVLLVLLAIAAPAAGTPATDSGETIVDVDLTLQDDGLLRVEETITVPDGVELSRAVPLRVAVDDDTDRIYEVEDIAAEGAAEAEVGDGTLTSTVGPGASTISYLVRGAVADGADEQVMEWHLTGWWDGPVDQVTASFVSPTPDVAFGDCLAGAPGSTAKCTFAGTNHEGILEVEHRELEAGHRIVLTTGLPAGTVPATAVLDDEPEPPATWSVTRPVLIALLALALLAAALVLYVLAARRRDQLALAAGDVPDVVVRDRDDVQFAVPGGILPGQAGTVIDASVDPVDLAATVIDLAVRGYLLIEELAGEGGLLEWRLTREAEPGAELRAMERAILDALLPDATPVTLSAVADTGRLDLGRVRQAMYGDVAERGWFGDRSGRGLPALLGGGLLVGGAIAAGVLAFTAGHALIGVVAMLAGGLVLVAPRFLPLRTPAGSAVAGDVLAMRRHLHALRAADVPEPEQELVFSRGLPYAVAFGDARHWLQTFAGLAPTADGQPGLAWFGGFEGSSDLVRFGQHFPHFLTELEGVFAEADHVASMGPLG